MVAEPYPHLQETPRPSGRLGVLINGWLLVSHVFKVLPFVVHVMQRLSSTAMDQVIHAAEAVVVPTAANTPANPAASSGPRA